MAHPVVAALNATNDLSAGTAGLQYVVDGTSSNCFNQAFSVFIGAATTPVATTTSNGTGAFSVQATLPEGPLDLRFEMDNGAGVVTSASRSVLVDITPPTLAFTTPTAAGGPYGSYVLPISLNVGGADGQTAYVFSKVGAAARSEIAQLVVAAGVAAGNGTFPQGTQTVTAEVADAAGNFVSAQQLNVVVDGIPCAIALTAPATDPAYLNRSNDLNTLQPDLQYRIRGTSSNCVGRTVTLFRGSPGLASGTTITDGSGTFQFDVSIPQGQERIMTEINNGAGLLSSDQVDITVDLTQFAITTPGAVATLNIGNDGLTQTPGIQAQLVYEPTPPPTSTVEICIDSSIGGAVTACHDGAAGWFTLATAVAPNTTTFGYPDGKYKLKAVLDVAGSISVTAAVDLTVDSVRPLVSAISLQNDANADRKINLTEQAAGAPIAHITFTGIEDGRPVIVRNSGASQTQYGSGSTLAGAADVTLTSLPSTLEALYGLVVEVTDAAGNKNKVANPSAYDPLNTAAFTTLEIDRLAPTFTISAPLKLQLGIADDADGLIAGYQVRVTGSTQTDVVANGVLMVLTPPGAPGVTLSPTGGAATNDFTVPGTGTTSYSIAVTPTDAAGNVGPTASKTVTVDLDPPTIALVSPNSAGSPYGTYSIPVTVNVGGAEGRQVTISTKLSAAPSESTLGQLTVSGGTATGNFTFVDGDQTVYARVSDVAGNPATATQVITVNGVGCSVSVTAPSARPAYLNVSNDANPGTAGHQFLLQGASANCFNAAVNVYRAGMVLLGSTTTNSSGAFSFSLSLTEGADTITVELDNGAGVLTSDVIPVVVDLTPPVVTAVSPTGANLWYVASSNINIRPPAAAGYFADLDPIAAGAQVSLGMTVAGAIGGTARVVYLGTNLIGPIDITTDPEVIPNTLATLPHNTAGNIEFRVVDSAGNEVIRNTATSVDVLAPAAPTVTAMLNGRRFVDLSWTETFDDGTTAASGAHQGYDVRWTTDVLSQTGIDTEAKFFDLAVSKQETGALLPAGTLARQLVVPALATYGILVRAVDEVGNYSSFTASSPLANALNAHTLPNPGTNGVYSAQMAANGDLNGDGKDDLVVSAYTGTAPGKVYVFFGNAVAANMTRQDLSPLLSSGGLPDSTNQNFGYDLSVGQVGDAASEGLPDLLVAAPTWTASQGRALLYFGRVGTTLDSTAFIDFRGSVAAANVGWTAQIIGDINNDGLGEIVLSAHAENSGRGRAYLFYGRSRSDWFTLQTNNGGSVPASASDRIIDGPTAGPTSGFSRSRGYAYLGDLNGDSYGDFTVPNSLDSVNKLFVFSGQTVVNKVGSVTTGDLPTVNDALQTLVGSPAGAGTSREGFGARAFGNVNLIGGAAMDLAVAQPMQSKIHIMADGAATGFSAAPFTISGTQFLGTSLAHGDIDGDGRQDLLSGQAGVSNASLFIFFNRGVAGAEFDQVAGAGFSQARLRSATKLGASVVVGDFTGDGQLDVAAGDPGDGNGKVTIWY